MGLCVYGGHGVREAEVSDDGEFRPVGLLLLRLGL